MDQNFFFKWVWRFNGLAFALVLLGLAAMTTSRFRPWDIAPAIESVIDPADPAQDAPKYTWNLTQARVGSSHAMLGLLFPAEDYDPLMRATYQNARTVNYLFVDTVTGATRWLFPTHKQVITMGQEIIDRPGVVPRMESAIVYNVVAGDPADYSPYKPATYQLYASKPDGSAMTKLMIDLDEAPTFVTVGTERIFVSAQSKGKPIVASFSLNDFKPLAQTDLSELTPK